MTISITCCQTAAAAMRCACRSGNSANYPRLPLRQFNNEGLKRTNADKEKSVKALLACERWCGMSDREIAHAAGVGDKFVAKQRKHSVSVAVARTSNTTNKETRLGKDGKRYAARRPTKSTAAPVPVRAAHKPPPSPKLTREQIGAPAAGTEYEQDPNNR
jgi:hypothetical protein